MSLTDGGESTVISNEDITNYYRIEGKPIGSLSYSFYKVKVRSWSFWDC